VRKDLADGQKAGVKTTPTFFLGLTDPNSSQIKAVTELVGAKSYATFKEALDRLLGGQK
jgi:predicted DsbA family dithiol-disulfide isomerase